MVASDPRIYVRLERRKQIQLIYEYQQKILKSSALLNLTVLKLRIHLFRMNAFTRIFTATEYFFGSLQLRSLQRQINELKLCSGTSLRHFFGMLHTVYF